MNRYVYLGDRLTDPALVGRLCDPVRRPDGRVIVGRRPRNQLVRFADGSEAVVLARRLRVTERQEQPCTPPVRRLDDQTSTPVIAGTGAASSAPAPAPRASTPETNEALDRV